MLISRKAEYAIIALMDMAALAEGSATTSKAIAERRNIPGNLIVQILSRLRKAGWVRSERGAGGGVCLIEEPSHINLRKVIEAFDGSFAVTRCLMNDKPCNQQLECPLRNVWCKAQNSMLEVLEGTTIRDLIESNTNSLTRN